MPKKKVKPSTEVLNFLKRRRVLSKARIQQVVAENLALSEAGERYLEQQMGPHTNLRSCIPLPGAKLKSMVEVVPQNPVDQPIVEKAMRIPSSLKPVFPAPADVVIKDVTHDDHILPLNANEQASDLLPPEGGERFVIHLEDDRKNLEDSSGQLADAKDIEVVILVASKDDVALKQPFKKSRRSLGSTSSLILEKLANVDPCANVSMRKVPPAV